MTPDEYNAMSPEARLFFKEMEKMIAELQALRIVTQALTKAMKDEE